MPDPKQQGVIWFAPTGHTLRGAFLDYWNKYGGLAQFGYPLSEEFFEPVGADNKLYQVQYFERNRFESHPENKGTQYEVLLGTLGQNFHAPDPRAAQIPNATYFQETWHNLSGAFKTYWESHGGLFVHGFPITEQFQEKNPTDGKEYTVQYFERSRFELHPENAGSQYEVLLGLLGVQLAAQKGYFAGVYPRYGYAADFSWLAGRITIWAPIGFSGSRPGCSILQYSTQDQRVQLNTSAGQPYGLSYEQVSTNIVALGRLAPNGGPEEPCLDDPEARTYYVEHKVQLNPVP